jgi:glycine cleavage system aminomethyltransferase T
MKRLLFLGWQWLGYCHPGSTALPFGRTKESCIEPIGASVSLPFRTSPAYASHAEAGAKFREKNGWRRVDYFAANVDSKFENRRPEGAAGENWSTAIVTEHQAVRHTAGLFDLTSFGKLEVWGPGASDLLEWVCSNRVSRGAGQLTYTQMLNDSGCVIGDVTVGQLADDGFLMVTGTSALAHDIEWLRAQATSAADRITAPFVIHDVTSAWACFGIWGPLSRSILAPLVERSLQTEDFSYMQMRMTTILGVPVRMARVTFVGELGWEIYVPADYGRWLWQELCDAVGASGGRRCGYKAIDSLRVEKGYLYLGADLTCEHTPYESGVGMFVRPGKDFLGRDALKGAEHPSQNLTALVIDEQRVVLGGGETVRGSDGLVSSITSGGQAHTLEASVAFAYLPAELPIGTRLAVDVGGREVSAITAKQPLYDPKGVRLRS